MKLSEVYENLYVSEVKMKFLHDVQKGEKRAAEKLKGGKAHGMTLEDIFNMHKSGKYPDLEFKDILKNFQLGLKVEREHTNDPEVAGEIARDHICEFPAYYFELEKMEDKLKHEAEVG